MLVLKILFIIFMICIFVLALLKWLLYRLNFMAVLMYCGEKGNGFPSDEEIEEYRLVVARNLLRDFRMHYLHWR